MIFKVMHKYCGYTMTIEGKDIFAALRAYGLSPALWEEVKGNA